MSRVLTSHKVNGCNEVLNIEVVDEPGSGGANHRYDISGFNTENNPSVNRDFPAYGVTTIVFQNGPIKESGVNGLTQEALLAVIEDRLVGFQAGPYATADNAEALDHVRGAMECLQRRTKERLTRGVEGTHAK